MMTILVVEDDATSREMLVMRLELKNYRVEVAEDGETALVRARQLKPAVILMDMNLPIMDGWEATRKLKLDASSAQIPIIGVSAHAMEGDRARALAAGCIEYEPKPINLASLLEKIRSVTGHN